ncbi:tetratricopeptide repeat protein [Cryptosporangium sp. NPDC048952]|uniref:tetratricopeptide repeat protein n=1 Tax=Cryptosporangium sp. NPDC048952 TaxID=3363961 RepID=UPI003718935E
MTETPEHGSPTGEAYDWFRRGEELLRQGNAAAAAQLLQRALAADPGSRSARESLARALFDSEQYEEARELFAQIVADHPSDDYAQFGLGLAALRTGDPKVAVEHLSLAVAMKPHDHHYATALRNARAQNLVDPVGGPATAGAPIEERRPTRGSTVNVPPEIEELLRGIERSDGAPDDDAPNGSARDAPNGEVR